MHPWNCPQIRSCQKRPDIFPAQFPRLPQLLQLSPAIADLEFHRALDRRLHNRFVLLTFQRTCGIDKPSARHQMGKHGFQDGNLP